MSELAVAAKRTSPLRLDGGQCVVRPTSAALNRTQTVPRTIAVSSADSDRDDPTDAHPRFRAPAPPGLRLLRSAATSTRLGPGVHVGSFELLAEVRRRATGPVWRARDRDLGTLVDIRFVRARPGEDTRVAPDQLSPMLSRLLDEARRWQGVSVEGVAEVLEVGVWQSQAYIASVAVRGQSLRTWMLGPARSFDEVIRIVEGIGRSLIRLHDCKLVHRDVTPDHIYVDGEGRTVLCDFALTFADGPTCHEEANPQKRRAELLLPRPASTRRGRRITASSVIERSALGKGPLVGTRGYRAPEASIDPHDPRLDQFGFAVTVYEVVYGVRPFEHTNPLDMTARLVGTELFGRSRVSGTPVSIVAPLRRALSVEPSDRFADVSAFVEALIPVRVERQLSSAVVWLCALGLLPWFVAVAPLLSWSSVEACRHDVRSAAPAELDRQRLRRIVRRFAAARPAVPDHVGSQLRRYADAIDRVAAQGCFDAYGPVRHSWGAVAMGCVETANRSFADLLERLEADSMPAWSEVVVAVAALPDVERCAGFYSSIADPQGTKTSLGEREIVVDVAGERRRAGRVASGDDLEALAAVTRTFDSWWPDGSEVSLRARFELAVAQLDRGDVDAAVHELGVVYRVASSLRGGIELDRRRRAELAAAFVERDDWRAVSWLVADIDRRITVADTACTELPDADELRLWLAWRREYGELATAERELVERFVRCPAATVDPARLDRVVAVGSVLLDWVGWGRAQIWLERVDAEDLAERTHGSDVPAAIRVFAARLALARGRARTATVHASRAASRTDGDRERAQAVWAQSLLAHGDHRAAAQVFDAFSIDALTAPQTQRDAEVWTAAAELAWATGDRQRVADVLAGLAQWSEHRRVAPALADRIAVLATAMQL